MRFRFLHAADVHLDSPLRGLALRDEERARAFASASRRAFENLVGCAREHEVAFVVIAGDLFDGDWKDVNTGLFFARQMGVLGPAGIRVFVVYGNHDAESVIRRSLPWPDNVTVFPARRPQTVEIEPLRVAVHGQSFARPVVRDNLALGYPAPKPGWFNLGILHTACNGRPGHEPYAPCSLDQLVAQGYDYWALGHVHAREVLHEHPHVVFPGNLQGRHIRETGAKGASLVTVADGRVVAVEPQVLDAARWARIEVDLQGLESKPALVERLRTALAVEAEAAGERPLAVRVVIAGESPLHPELAGDPRALHEEIEAVALAVSEQIWLEKVRLSSRDPAEDVLAVRADVLGELLQLVDEVVGDDQFRAQLAAELATLAGKLPRVAAGGVELPSPERLEELIAEGDGLLRARLLGEERR